MPERVPGGRSIQYAATTRVWFKVVPRDGPDAGKVVTWSMSKGAYDRLLLGKTRRRTRYDILAMGGLDLEEVCEPSSS